jgi:hypothetical protein
MKTLLIAAILILACNAAQAATGNEYLAFDTRTQANMVADIVTGLFTAFAIMNEKPPACIPEGVTNGQISKLVIQTLQKQPQHLHYDMGVLLMATLTNNFPCTTTQKTSKPETKF